MGVHEEKDLDQPPALDQEGLEGLRHSASEITRELKRLSARVSELVAAVEALAPAPVGRAKPIRSDGVAAVAADAEQNAVTTVTVSPLPELAMAAVAETTLRNLPGVQQVTGVKREGDWARFTLEVSPDTDLVSEMRLAMPVSFKVTDSTPGALSLTLQWAWGTY